MMRFFTALLATFVGTAAIAEVTEVPTTKTVEAATQDFVAAVEAAGAKVFAVVDHGKGAQSVGSDIGGVKLVVFGNPKVGTPAMEISPLAGLVLPLHVLVYETEDGTVLAYEDPATRLTGVSGKDFPAEVLAPMNKALAGLTGKAAN